VTDKFNNRIELFRMPDGALAERRTEILPDGSLGQIHGAREVTARTDAELAAAGVQKVSEDERLEIEAASKKLHGITDLSSQAE